LGIHLTADATFFDAGSSAANFFLFLKLSGIALALTVVFATITRRLIENPGIALGKKLIQRINTSSTVKCGAIGDILFH
jgi:peptidoglycan/LPS O-acetylase OafA/YrhL